MADANSRDLILAPNQEAYVQDQTKGNLNVYVGPNKTSLANTDQPVRYNSSKNKYEKCSLEEAIFEFPRAVEGQYIVLENHARDEKKPHPPVGSSQQADLNDGRKVNIAGPAMFPLWPGQVAKVIEGHRLRSNQYLLVSVYNEEAARTNWAKTVVKPAAPAPAASGEQGQDGAKSESAQAAPVIVAPAENLTIGRLLVIKGSEVSYYIPPTGIEVLPDEDGEYVRDAVTLERLEYCILLDESGDKRTVKGPKVVFPEPTETFIEKDGKRKFRAIELNDDMGIYVKVIADYEEDGKKYQAGQELFITGKQQRIYYPREEHAIIKYGAQERHYGVVIPEGDGRYLLDKQAGKIGLKRGPCILLCDPRNEVLIRRVLEDRQVCLWYPGNEEARRYNAKLRELVRGTIDGSPERGLQEATVAAAIPAVRNLAAKAGAAQQVDEFQRGSSYNPPRTLTLDSKYEGAVAIKVWANHAVLITGKTGNRRVAVGPTTVLLEYDEELHVMGLSTGKPKTTDKLLETCYLKVTNNQVTDIVTVVTRDLVSVDLKLSYRINFEGDDPEKWFAVENYVKRLCDHVRSVLQHTAKQVGIREFNNNSIPTVRDAILGTKGTDGSARPGLKFDDNGMRVCDVEVLAVTIGDASVNKLLTDAQNKAVSGELELARLEKELELATRRAEIQKQLDSLKEEAEKDKAAQVLSGLQRDLALTLKKAEKLLTEAAEQAKVAEAQRKANADAASAELALERAAHGQQLELEARHSEQRILNLTKEQELKLKAIEAEAKALGDKAAAISPALVAALGAFGDRYIAGKAAEAMSPLAHLGGGSVAEVLSKLLRGTALEGAVKQLAPGNGVSATTVSTGAHS